ncbi:MAG: hypothetical protein HYW90_01530 [Candidatus Sungbacteria bacterium]|nr:hypothetical protein [Candidatus Sungbacteria bacterium]
MKLFYFPKFVMLSFAIIALSFFAVFFVTFALNEVSAQISNITYPVAELGSCVGQQECEAYCGVPSNYSKCAAFAQKNNLAIEIPDDKKAVFAAMQKGESPGGCKDEASCRNYCEDIDHIEECVNFVEKFNLASSDELKEIRQMADVKKAGVAFPGNCKTKENCLKYCDNSDNAVVCMEFALKAGFIPKADTEAVSKILPYLKSGGKLPGGCTTRESCDTYCNDDAHVTECINFAEKTGFVSKEDADIVRKTGGKSPGNCKSKEACDSYCKSETHIDECVDFAVKAGLISKEDAEMAKRFKITSGPGGCKSKADCEAFCVVNQDTCFQFAKDHGMLSEEDLKNIEEQKKFLESLGKASPEWFACMEKELGSPFFERFKAGKLTQTEAKSPALEKAQRKCGGEMAQEKEAACLALSCSEFESCLKALQSSGGDQDGEQQEEGAPNPAVNAKAQSCQQEKINACLAKSCSEFDACVNALQQGGGKQGGQQQQGESDPKLKAKIQACTDEKINACIAKPCGEFQACLNSLGAGGEGGAQQGAPNPAVQSKLMTCFPPPPSGE